LRIGSILTGRYFCGIALTGPPWSPARPTAFGIAELGEDTFPEHPARRTTASEVEIAVDNKRIAANPPFIAEANVRRRVSEAASAVAGLTLKALSSWTKSELHSCE
jgi:hypothetical protein